MTCNTDTGMLKKLSWWVAGAATVLVAAFVQLAFAQKSEPKPVAPIFADSSRIGSVGGRTHEGVDITVTPGQIVPIPIDGEIIHKRDVYGKNNMGLSSTHIRGTGKYAGFTVKIFYVDNRRLALNSYVKAGDPLGPAQDIRVKHGNSMLPYIHYEMYRIGKLIDPTGMLP